MERMESAALCAAVKITGSEVPVRLASASPLAVVHRHLSLISQLICNCSQAVSGAIRNISSVGTTIAFDRDNAEKQNLIKPKTRRKSWQRNVAKKDC